MANMLGAAPLLVNGGPLTDDSSHDVPITLVAEDGVRRVKNCSSYASE